MEQQRFDQILKTLDKPSEPVTIDIRSPNAEVREEPKRKRGRPRKDPNSPKNGRTAPKTEEHKAKISAALKGRKRSDETRAKMSKARKGMVPWNKGKHKAKPTLFERVLGYLKGLFAKCSK